MIPYALDGYEVVDARDLPETLRGYVEWFLLANRHLHTMGGSRNQCGFATGQFINQLLATGYIEYPPGERWENAEAAIIDGMDHRVLRLDEWMIDFTARQFSMTAPWPLIWRRV